MAPAGRWAFWSGGKNVSGLDSLHELERRDRNGSVDAENRPREHEVWIELTGGLWWDACRDAARARRDLLGEWTGDPAACWALQRLGEDDPAPPGHGAGAADRALHLARLAAFVTGDGPEDGLLTAMVRSWSQAATLPAGGVPGGLPRAPRYPRVQRVADLLAPMEAGAAGAMVFLQALWLAEGRPPAALQRREIKVLLAPQWPDGTGLVGRLELELMPDGPPGLFPDPRTMGMFTADEDFQEALTAAWKYQTQNRRRVPCVVWRLEIAGYSGRRVVGASLGAAFAVLLRELLGPPQPGTVALSRLAAAGRLLTGLLRHPYPGHAVTGDVTEQGGLERVGGLQAKVDRAAAAKLTVVAPEANEGEVAGENIIWVGTAAQARRRLYRFNRLRSAVVALVLMVAFAATATGQWAAQVERERARDDQDLSRRLAAQSVGRFGASPRDSIALALAAWTAAPTPEARGALLTAHGRLVNDRLQRTGPVSSVAFSSDGRLLATTGEDRSVRLWDMAGRTLAATLPGRRVAFSPDGSMIATGDETRTVRLWNAADAKPLATLTGHPGPITSLAFSPDSRLLASVGGDVRLWRTGDRRLAAAVPVKRATEAVFGKSGLLVVAGGRVELFGTRSLPEVPRLRTLYHATGSPGILISPDGLNMAITGNPLVAETTWLRSAEDESTGVRLAGGPVTAFAPSGDVVALARSAATGGPPITLWSTADGNPLATLGGFGETVESMAFSPDGRTLAIVDLHATVTLIGTGRPRAAAALGAAINAVAYGAGGRIAAAGSGDGTVTWWNPADRAAGAVRVAAHRHGVRAIAISPDGTTMVSAGNDRTAKVWGFAGRRLRATLTAHAEPVVAVAFSPDGRTIVTADASDNAVLWDARTFRRLRVLPHAFGNWSWPLVLSAIAFSPDGHSLIGAGAGGAIDFVDADGHGVYGQFSNPGGFIKRIRDIAVSPDGRTIISADADGGITRWPVGSVYDGGSRTGSGTLVMRGADANTVAYSPDGRTIALGGNDHTIRLLDAATRRTTGVLQGHRGEVLTLSFRPDGRGLLAGDSSGDVREWNLDPGRAVPELCTALSRDARSGLSSGLPYNLADGWQEFLSRFTLTGTCHRPRPGG
ncbi:WD40 repeat domain-containing protein [Actinomadura macrotermitis]|uniref:WD40 repeat domain-containing protein n=1 Tax=Actinomadura macrotermitis TaxID=2585200 RepID=A0A7K0C1F6_9ACTN|nr:WD40 repeat domain-containing protein [Actinomadura macrotermitis]MQY07301.1 hypothetical protein [Actinomadura macrotermitis]